jgi:acetolactate decarboxylase
MTLTNFPGPVPLTCAVSAGVRDALRQRMERTGETLDQAVTACLAEALDVEHHSIFQVSTSGALVQGVYQAATTIGDVRRHGDFGLGTFVALDGEGILLDGTCFRAGSDGSLAEVPDSTPAPFWVATRFCADLTVTLEDIQSWDDLCARLTALRPSGNLLAAIRLDGVFDFLHVRVACKTQPGTSLVEATSHQAEFEFENLGGTLAGFFTPAYARTINVPGYHLHLLSADRRHGGHVLGIRSKSLRAAIHTANDLHIVLPENAAFLHADLNGDPAAALAKAEGAHPRG